jgi:membrane-bound ClpP family serine protease
MPAKKTTSTKKPAAKKTTAKKTAAATEKKIQDTAKDLAKQGKESVEKIVDSMIDDKQMKAIESKTKEFSNSFVEKIHTAGAKERVLLVVGAFFLVWGIVTLWHIALGIILLLVALVLLNMFFNRKD